MSDDIVQKNDFKAGDTLTSSHLNTIANGIIANKEAVANAKEAATAASEAATQAAAAAQAAADAVAANSEADEATRAQVQANKDAADAAAAAAQAAAEQAAQVAADLEANATADAQLAEQVQTNIANIQANADKATQALDAIAANAEADEATKALALANKELIEANTAADAELAGRVGVVEQNYVSKADTQSGVKAQTLYNLVTHKVTASNGDVAQIFGESDGGGTMFTSSTNDFKSYVGCNNEKTLGVQIYVKNISDNVGCRLNCGQQGFFYTTNKANGSYTADDELTTKGTAKALIVEYLQSEEGKDVLKAILQEIGVVLGE